MAADLLLFAAGLALLTLGAKWLVDGASALALNMGVSHLVVGMSVVAFGTSMPEFVFNLASTASDASDLAIGNVVGSNIANIALILGATAVLRPVLISQSLMRKEFLFMGLTALTFFALTLDDEISRLDGVLLSVCFVGFLYWLFRSGKVIDEVEAEIEAVEPKSRPWLRNLVFVVIGLAGLVFGAKLMVDSATRIALLFGISQMVIGVTIVAIGTSLPELAASITATLRNHGDLSLGNVVGSNIFNVLFVIGFTSVISPLRASDPWTPIFHMPVMMLAILSVVPFYLISKKLGRTAGIVMLVGYSAYLFLCYRIGTTGGF